ncbi:MAG: DUF6531 domain-containing protein [Methylobacter sp.]|nr:DUF6531 domain-containing protein [Methylobacter sp.]MCL7419919.1 DUF6531 domain-containing protein [Methylobacter sp.]
MDILPRPVKPRRVCWLLLGLLYSLITYGGLPLSLALLPAPALAGTCDGDGDAPDWDDQFDPRCNPPDPAKERGCSADSNVQQCTVGKTSGNPIQNSTGNKFQLEVDYRGAGPFPLQLVRTYNSQSDITDITDGPFGAHWSFRYGGRIQPVSATQVKAIRADEKTFTFRLVGGVWTPDADVHSRLQALANGGWRYTNGRDGVETYDADGRLLSIADRTGLTQTLAYDGTGRLTAITGPFGRTLQLAYDSQNRISAITDPAGNRYRYDYDSANNLSAVTYPDGHSRRYRYENPGWPPSPTPWVTRPASPPTTGTAIRRKSSTPTARSRNWPTMRAAGCYRAPTATRPRPSTMTPPASRSMSTCPVVNSFITPMTPRIGWSPSPTTWATARTTRWTRWATASNSRSRIRTASLRACRKRASTASGGWLRYWTPTAMPPATSMTIMATAPAPPTRTATPASTATTA